MSNEGMEMNAGYASVVTFTDAQDAEVAKKIHMQESGGETIATTSEKSSNFKKTDKSKAKLDAKNIADAMISMGSSNSNTARNPAPAASKPTNRERNQRQNRSRTE
jgi:hypothetical protein